MSNYTVLHCHTQYGNGGFIDSTASYSDYVDLAVSLGMKAIAFTEHGSCMSWYKKKVYCEEHGLKYIHAEEFYVTETMDEKLKDNYHCCLYAKNFDGFKELNKLSSISYRRNEENRFYYNPRITLDELINTSDNIIIATACIGGILSKGTESAKTKFIDFMKENKHRCFLELQPHNVNAQKEYNRYLLELHEETKIPLTVGTDSHCLNDMESRSILQKSKNIKFEDESGWDLSFKSYDDVVNDFEKQDVIPKDKYLEALENTNSIAYMVEEFELDYSNKYPTIFDNPEEMINKKIEDGLRYRGLRYNDYKERIEYELDTYKKNGALQFLLLDDMVKIYCRENNIKYGYGRGSVSGSFIAYLMQITEINPIQWDLSFERFMSPDRVSLADVDSDYEPSKRDLVKDFLFSNSLFNCCEILTHNTIALKGAIRDVGRALEIDLKIVNEICKNIEIQEDKYRKEFPELFKYVDELNGVVVSVGSHPCGVVVLNGNIDELIGTFSTSTTDHPISQLDMKEIDAQNYVKLDILGLDNIELLNKACELANIEWLTPDNIDYMDEKVWESIRESSCMVFQMESNFAFDTYRKTFSKETLSKIKKETDNFNPIDLLSMVNGAIRPSGESFRVRMSNGEKNDNGHEALNDFLKDTLGFLLYQEQIIDFLHIFCGFTKGKADIVRRGFAKKTGTEQFLPEIKSGFIKTMMEKYDTTEEKANELIESFLTIIENASGYGFSKNHSHSYSFIGYACAWMRYYYPFEFITAALNIYKDNEDKTASIVEYASLRKIKISPIKFRHSVSEYTFDKDTNTIYNGISSVKFSNMKVGNYLYSLKDNEYKTFVDILEDLPTKKINSRQLDIFTKLDYFSEFGNSKLLLILIDIYDTIFNKGTAKQISKEKLIKFGSEQIREILHNAMFMYSSQTDKKYIISDIKNCMREVEKQIRELNLNDFSIIDKIKFQQDYLGYISSTGKEEDRRLVYVKEVYPVKRKKDGKKCGISFIASSLGSGKTSRWTCWDSTMSKHGEINKESIIRVESWKHNPEYNNFELTNYSIVK